MFSMSLTKKAQKLPAIPLAALLLGLVVAPISNAFTDNYDLKGDIAKVAGKTYGEWAAKWWQWAFKTEFAQFEDGDVDCSAGQKGDVWFLAGSITGTPASRTCLHKIPQGKILFFPLVNYGFWNPDDSCPADQGNNCTVAQKRENANGFFSDQIPGNLGGSLATYACQLNATVDGVPVQTVGYPIVRTQSPVFPLKSDGPVFQVDDPETIDDGYYVAIPPLKKGTHTIKFTGGICGFNQSPQDIADDPSSAVFLVDVTYELTVGK